MKNRSTLPGSGDSSPAGLPLLVPLLLLAVAAAAPDEESEQEIVVEGERPDAPDPDRTPSSLTVIEVDERLPASAGVAEAVEHAPGVNLLQLGGLGDFSAVSIRGSDLRQVQVYLDGVPLNPDGSAVVNLAELPLRAFSRVEVYRGNAPTELAAAPVGGVVNLVTGEDPAPPGFLLSYGSLDTLRASMIHGGEGELLEQPTDSFLAAEVFGTRGDFSYFSDNGTRYNRLDDARSDRENNDKSQISAHGRFRLGDQRLRLTLLDAFLARDEGIPGPVNAPVEQARLETLRNLGVLQIEGATESVRLQGQGWVQSRQESLDDRLGEVGVGSQQSRDLFTTIGLLAHGRWVPDPAVAPALTLSGRRDAFVGRDLLLNQEAALRTRLALMAAASTDLRLWQERILLSPVLQAAWLDNRALGAVDSADPAIARDVEAELLPRVGLLLRPLDPLALKANAGRYFRPPDLTEIFGDRGALSGNPDLLPETGWQADAGARLSLDDGAWGSASIEVAHFWNSLHDAIVYVQNSQRTAVPVNIGRAWAQGVEGAMVLDLFGRVDSRSALTWTLSRNLVERPEVEGKQLPRRPTWEIHQATSIHWEDRLRLGHDWSFLAGNYWDATNFFLSAPRSLHGVFLRARPGREPLEIELSILNLFDRTVGVVPQNPLDPGDGARVVEPVTDFVGYPLPGRTWMLSLRWSADPPEPEAGP